MLRGHGHIPRQPCLLPAERCDSCPAAIAAMGAIFSGSVRAPLTGIILIIEITGAFGSSLPIIIACMMAAITAEGLSGEPIYNELKQLKQNRGVSEC